MTRVAALIFHVRPGPAAGPLGEVFAAIRQRNADRLADCLRRAGADDVRIVAQPPDERSFGSRLRDVLESADAEGIIVLGSGSVPLAGPADLAPFVATAAGPAGNALANNRFSADIIAIAGLAGLTEPPDLAADNGLPRWLAESAGFTVGDLGGRWRLQVDLDSPLDALLAGSIDPQELDASGVPSAAVRAALRQVATTGRDPDAELVVAGRASAGGLAWLERATASRTRALIEERGFRTRPAGQRPVRSVLGLLLDRDGPAALGAILAELGDGALVDSRVLLAHRFGADERRWPTAEDRFASDLLLVDRIADPWLRALTAAACDGPIPIVLGGHSLVGPGLRLVLGRGLPGRRWT